MAQNVYGGLAQVGQLKAQIGLGVSVCLALSLCVSGAMALNSARTDKHTATVNATLSSSGSCSSNTCPGLASYKVGSASYTLSGTWNNPLPTSTTIAYDPSNPTDSEQNPPSFTFGFILLTVAVCIAIIGFVIYKITMAYKPIAALEGADAIYNLGRAVI